MPLGTSSIYYLWISFPIIIITHFVISVINTPLFCVLKFILIILLNLQAFKVPGFVLSVTKLFKLLSSLRSPYCSLEFVLSLNIVQLSGIRPSQLIPFHLRESHVNSYVRLLTSLIFDAFFMLTLLSTKSLISIVSLIVDKP